jgi:hypothetical protein
MLEQPRAFLFGVSVGAWQQVLAGLSEESVQRLNDKVDRMRAKGGPFDAHRFIVELVSDPAMATVADSDDSNVSEDPLAAARERGVHARAELLNAEGGLIPASRLGQILGVSRQTINQWRKRGRILGVRRGRAYQFPKWQIYKNDVLPGLGDVLAVLKHIDDWSKLDFLVTPDPQLDDSTPLAFLRAYKTDSVIRAATRYGEQGAR